MSSVILLKKIMSKTNLTVEKLAERTNIDENLLTNFLNEKTKLEVEDYIKIGKYFNLSLDTIVNGKANEKDKLVLRDLEPSEREVVENYLEKCNKIIVESGLKKHQDKLLPKAKHVVKWSGKVYLSGFEGGVFKNDGIIDIGLRKLKNAYIIINIEELLKLDDYDIYSKLKEYCNTRSSSSKGGGSIRPISKLKLEDVLNLTDIRFFEEIKLNTYDTSALYKIKPNNKSYWAIIDLLIEKGAYLERVDHANQLKFGEHVDIPATQMLRYIAKKNLK